MIWLKLFFLKIKFKEEPVSEEEIDSKNNVKIGSFSGILKLETIKAEIKTEIKSEIKTEIPTELCDENMSRKSREIAIELLDVSNEEKYEKLVTEEKIKSTFKRRFSDSSSCDKNMKSPDDNKDLSKKSKLTNQNLPYNLHERYVLI